MFYKIRPAVICYYETVVCNLFTASFSIGTQLSNDQLSIIRWVGDNSREVFYVATVYWETAFLHSTCLQVA